MAYSLTTHTQAPILVAHITQPFDPSADSAAISRALAALLRATRGPVIYIADLSTLAIGFGQIVAALSEVFRRPENAAFTDPRVTFLVAGNPVMYSFATVAAKQTMYGNADLPLYPTLEEALAEAHRRLAQPSDAQTPRASNA